MGLTEKRSMVEVKLKSISLQLGLMVTWSAITLPEIFSYDNFVRKTHFPLYYEVNDRKK